MEDLYACIKQEQSLESEGNFDYIPVTFYGIDTRNFGTTIRDKNAFNKLVEIAIDTNKSFLDRFQTIRYLQRIPKNNKYTEIYKCMDSILTDTNIPFETRYLFFSNNERIIKLNYELVTYGHLFMYNYNQTPLLYKIISAEYILSTLPIEKYDSIKLQQFLYDTGNDIHTSINCRAECADVLSRYGYEINSNGINYKQCGLHLIQKLGDLYSQNKIKTIYSNAENVHDTSINNSVIECIRYLLSTIDVYCNTDEIYEFVKNYDERCVNAYKRIIVDPAKYEGRSMMDIMLLVWQFILNSKDKTELQKRFIQELQEMDSTCSSGHVSRLINVLSGFINFNTIKITFEEQIRNNIYSYIQCMLKLISLQHQELIVEEMVCVNKPTINEFINRFLTEKFKSELREEFKEYINEENFNKIYDKSIHNYFGI